MVRILVLCTGNSCRSQMMQAYLQKAVAEKATVYSAGIETHGVNPTAIRILKEDGVDISGHTSNHIDEYRDIRFDIVITVCDHARENCPWFPSDAKRLHKSFTDPAGKDDEVFRQVRDEIREYANEFAKEHIS